MEVFFTILIIVGVILLTAVVFSGWLLIKIARLVSRGIASLLGVSRSQRPAFANPSTLQCPRPRCHADNRPSAHFCRRCGIAMTAQAMPAQQVRVRQRAAMY